MDAAGATATLVADYVTSNTTRIDRGVLRVDGKAEQSAGVFVLGGAAVADATVKVLGNGAVLGIRGGKLIGTGTVDANLHLGNQTTTGDGALSPGIDPTDLPPPPGSPPPPGPPAHNTGRIDITQSFHLFNQSVVRMDIRSDTAYDRVNVAGYAAFGVGGAAGRAGTLTVWTDQNYKPAAGTTVNFFVAGGGLVGDFAAKVLDPPGFNWSHPANPGKPHHWVIKNSGGTYYVVVELPP
ncbi:MAG: hypothetical protein K2X87_28485 [Gemmataceae bacterium]|nr:hypothetical protein [Gemmataceae bacterium]